MEISDLIKSARIEKGLTQQQLADAVFVTRQTISKWELGKSVPDQASLVLLYQCLDIKDNEKKQLSKLIFNKQNIILVLIAILFSPIVIGVRFIYCKIDKIENRKTKTIIKTISFVVFSLYLISLKENVAYLLIGIFSIGYLLYQFYLSNLENKWFMSVSLRQAIIHKIQVCQNDNRQETWYFLQQRYQYISHNSHKFMELKFHDTYMTVPIFFRISPISETIIIFTQTSLFVVE